MPAMPKVIQPVVHVIVAESKSGPALEAPWMVVVIKQCGAPGCGGHPIPTTCVRSDN
jgi:hypothetical protein